MQFKKVQKSIFKDLDISSFWEDNNYALEVYIEDYPLDKDIEIIEKKIGYKLPLSYIELMRTQNGGIPFNTCFPTKESTSWAENHIAISGIMGIGNKKRYSLLGSRGHQFMIEEWKYPKIGICICDCPSGGHDIVMLDYRKCKNDEEPKVVHVDQELDYKITFLAKNFESFIRGLVDCDLYEDD